MRDVSGAHGRWVRWRCINTYRSGNARIGKRAADRVRRRHGWPPVASLCRFSPLLLSSSSPLPLHDYHLPFFRFCRVVYTHHRGCNPPWPSRGVGGVFHVAGARLQGILEKKVESDGKKKERKVKGIAVGRMDKLFLFLRSMVKLARMGNF